MQEKALLVLRCQELEAASTPKTQEAEARAGGGSRADTIGKRELPREISAAPAPAKATLVWD